MATNPRRFPASSEHGTLVITLPCSEGLVICTDKRVTKGDEIVSDEEVKIHQLGPKAVFTGTGLCRAQSVDPKVADFELFRVVKDAVAGINLNYFTKHRGDIARSIAASLESTLRTTSDPKLGPRKTGCQILFWHLDALNMLHGTRIDIDYDEARSANASIHVLDLDTKLVSGPNLAGDCDPFSELRNPARTDLQHLRDDPRFRRSQELKKPEQWRALSTAEAAEIGGYLISASSEVQNIGGVAVPSISPKCDCALLSPSGRFTWLT